MKTINKTLLALAMSVMALGANAQVDKAASEATSAAQHTMDQKRAEAKASDSGVVGKAVNNTKAEYHKKMAEKDTHDAKDALGMKSKSSKATTDAAEAVEHKLDQKRAEAKAANSGPIGKAVNNTKAKYHKKMADTNAKDALGMESEPMRESDIKIDGR